jgi:hypothetical protein
VLNGPGRHRVDDRAVKVSGGEHDNQPSQHHQGTEAGPEEPQAPANQNPVMRHAPPTPLPNVTV